MKEKKRSCVRCSRETEASMPFGLCFECREVISKQHYDENHRKRGLLEIIFGR